MNKYATYLLGYGKMDRMQWVRLFFLTVSLFASVWGLRVSAQGFDSPAAKIERNQQQIADMDGRIKTLETQRLDARIATLEALGEANSEMLRAIFICLLGLIGEAMFRLVLMGRYSKKESEGK